MYTITSHTTEIFLEEDVNPILDLTCLLTTGRSSDSLSDFLGSGEQISERVSLIHQVAECVIQ